MMKNLMFAMFGNYTAVTYMIGEDEVIPSGLSGVDFPYVLGVLLFALVTYCVFRILGEVISK